MKKTVLRKYAQLIAQTGVNVSHLHLPYQLAY